MARAVVSGVIITGLLVACGPVLPVRQATGPKATEAPNRGPQIGRPSPILLASPLVGGATGQPLGTLQRPPGPATEISGVLRLDAAYLTSKAKARVIANQGATAVAVGPAELLSDAGGNIISNNSAGMVSKIRYQLTQAEPSTSPLSVGEILPAAGLAITAHSLRTGQPLPIGVDGGGQPVFGIYSSTNGRFTLYLPPEEVGSVLVSARVPEAEDARLEYDLITPAREQGERIIDEDSSVTTRLMRQAFVGKFANLLAARDEHLFAAGQVGPPSDAALAEATQIATSELLGREAGASTGSSPLSSLKPLLVVFLSKLYARLDANAAIAAVPWTERPPLYKALAQQMGDVILATITGIDRVQINQKLYLNPYVVPGYASNPLHEGSAFESLTAIFRDLREKAPVFDGRLNSEEVRAYFATRPYLRNANRLHAELFLDAVCQGEKAMTIKQRPGCIPQPTYEILKPTDLGEFLVKEYFSQPDYPPYVLVDPASPTQELQTEADPNRPGATRLKVEHVFSGHIRELGRTVIKDLNPAYSSHVDVLYAASESITQALAPALLTSQDLLLDVIERYERNPP